MKTHLNRSLVLLMAAACGTIVANLYYAQPLLSLMARTFHVPEASAGIVPMLTQTGYALGMFLILPLGDIRERRSLIIIMLSLSMGALAMMSVSPNMGTLLFSAFAIGFTSVVPHLIVSFAAQLAVPEERGKTIGTVMSGLLIGIILSRTFSGLVGGAFGWRLVYALAVCFILALALSIRFLFPVSKPTSKLQYSQLLGSLWELFRTEPVLRKASFSGAMMFGAFSTFWTSLIFLLESPAYKLGAQAAGLFGLIGIVGALAAPLMGRYADKKSPRFTLGIAISSSILSYLCFWAFGLSLWGLVLGVTLLDFGTQSGQISNQTRIYALNPEARNRINTVFMVFYFIGGSFGSFISTYLWSLMGWPGICLTGLTFLTFTAFSHFVGK